MSGKIQQFDFSVDILRALLWRNNEAVNIQALLQHKQDYFDLANVDFWTNWSADVFDLRTATKFGLIVWSVILGINITISPGPGPDNESFGFGPLRKNFSFGNFNSGLTDIPLTVEDARTVLRLRYYQLTTNCNVTGVNLLLADIFGSQGIGYVQDNFDMTIEYIFDFSLGSELKYFLGVFDVLPRPAGVIATITDV